MLVTALAGALLATLGTGAVSRAEGADAPLELHRTYAFDGVDRNAAMRNLVEMNLMPSVDTGVVPNTHPPITDDKACPPSRCRDYVLPRPAGVKVSTPKVRVLLPVGYNADKTVRYPVVYLWNGALSPYFRWSRATELTAMSRSMKAIFVMPEGGYGSDAGFFTDWHDGSFDWETWHIQHLLPWVDKNFRTIKGARAGVGASMGALGALTYAARHPGLFKSVLSISGMVDTIQMTTYGTNPELAKALALKDPHLGRVWGDPVLNRSTWSEHNPTELAPQLKNVKLFIASGTGYAHYNPDDEIHSGIVELNLWNQHREFFAALTRAKVPYQARVAIGQLHDWPYFHEAMVWGLPKVIAAARK